MSSLSQYIWAQQVGGTNAVPYSALDKGEQFRFPTNTKRVAAVCTKTGAGWYTIAGSDRRGRCRTGTAVIRVEDES